MKAEDVLIFEAPNRAEILTQLDARVAQRRQQATGLGLNFDNPLQAIEQADSEQLNPQIYRQIQRAQRRAATLTQSLSVVGRGVPVIEPVVNRLRGALHSVALYYVNMLASQQTTINEAALDALADVAAELETSKARIAELERKLATLQTEES